MKILLLSFTDSGGGAAIAASNLLDALTASGLDVDMGVVNKQSARTNVFELPKKSGTAQMAIKLWQRLHNKLIARLFSTSNPILHSEANHSIVDVDYINKSDYDLVHLHWINGNMLSIRDIGALKKPLVWTMHDSWPFCGAEHHPNIWEHDERFSTGYYRKNKPASTNGPDICRRTWDRKRKFWRDKVVQFISPSRWEKDLLDKSALWIDAHCEVIPNIVPPEVFRQIPMANTRAAFGLPLGKKIIGFGAAYDIIDSKSIKGGDLLLDALRKLPKDGDYFLLAFGPVGQKFQNEVGFPSFYSGYVQNPGILAALYNSCDVFVLPSVIENLSTTAMEAQFCGVPVVAFATGGNSDIVEHRSTGYLAPLFDIKELAHGIEYCIKNHDRLSKRAAARMKSEFSADSIVLAHITLYKSMFENQRNQKVLCHVDKP